MSGVVILREGKAGRITLDRPEALNALTHEIARTIETALEDWRDDDAVALVVMDARGDKAFCAGGDLARLYETGRAGDFEHGRRFWRDEYRLNAKLAAYPKPIVSLMQGFVMGGGVGLGCHVSHRVVDTDTRVSMPECGIGLVPDVGGSLLLARAPGRMGEYLGLTATRMRAADAIYCGFADTVVGRAAWPALTEALCETGTPDCIAGFAIAEGDSALAALQGDVDRSFGGEGLTDVLNALRAENSDFSADALSRMARHSPLSMGVTLEMVHRLRAAGADIRKALELEFRFTARAMEQADFLEGIRALIIDKDNAPRWRHRLDGLPAVAVSQMLLPLGAAALNLED